MATDALDKTEPKQIAEMSQRTSIAPCTEEDDGTDDEPGGGVVSFDFRKGEKLRCANHASYRAKVSPAPPRTYGRADLCAVYGHPHIYALAAYHRPRGAGGCTDRCALRRRNNVPAGAALRPTPYPGAIGDYPPLESCLAGESIFQAPHGGLLRLERRSPF